MVRDGQLVEMATMGFHIPIPADGTVFDFMFDFDEMRWADTPGCGDLGHSWSWYWQDTQRYK